MTEFHLLTAPRCLDFRNDIVNIYFLCYIIFEWSFPLFSFELHFRCCCVSLLFRIDTKEKSQSFQINTYFARMVVLENSRF